MSSGPDWVGRGEEAALTVRACAELGGRCGDSNATGSVCMAAPRIELAIVSVVPFEPVRACCEGLGGEGRGAGSALVKGRDTLPKDDVEGEEWRARWSWI